MKSLNKYHDLGTKIMNLKVNTKYSRFCKIFKFNV